MTASETLSWAVIAALTAAGWSTRRWIKSLPVTHVRTWLLDLSWCFPMCLVMAMLALGDLPSVLLMSVMLGPIAAARSVMFAVLSGEPPRDPDAVPEDIRRERDELRARLLSADSEPSP